MNINNAPLTRLTGKPAAKFTREDMLKLVDKHGIRMVNFMYPAADGRLKTLNFVVNDEKYLESILTCGERVDGSSLFPFIEAGSSDLYVVPRYRTAFIDPFAELPTLCFLCSYFNKDGERLAGSPDNTLHKASEAFTATTGMTFEAMGELEYYVMQSEEENPGLAMYPAANQKGYHESGPFAKFNDFRTECMYYISLAGGKVKYGHSEVGTFTLDGKLWEQNEIEFLPTDVEEAADQLVIAKWIIRKLGFSYGFDVSFAPKITEGKAGSGLHVHMRLMKDGKNMMLSNGALSDDARKMIAGLMDLAPSITAFGNANPTSYFRLVPRQEAPTNICWGDRNRSVLVRVPLGWTSQVDMSAVVNPREKGEKAPDTSNKQTVEIRSADGSADVYQLLSAVCVAARHGFEMPKPLEVAKETYVDVNIHKAEHRERTAKLAQLPDSCVASAAELERQRAVYEQHGVFDARMIDSQVALLRAFDDADRAKLNMKELVARFFHCG